MRHCGNADCHECPPLPRTASGRIAAFRRHPRRRGVSPRPWRVNKDQEIIDAQGNTVAWGYHEDMGHLFDKIRLPDARLIVKLVNSNLASFQPEPRRRKK